MANGGEGKRKFLIEIMGDTDQAVKAIDSVATALKNLETNAKTATGKITASFAGVEKGAGAAGKAGVVTADSFFQSAAIVAAAAYTMKRGLEATLGAAADLELQIDRVNDVIDGELGPVTQRAATRFLEAGRNASDMVGAMSEFAKIGVEGAARLEHMADVAFKFGTVTDQSASQAAESISRFALHLGVTGDKVENLASSLVFLSEKTGVSTREMQFFVSMLGATAQKAGLTNPEILGIAARLGQLGIAGKKAAPGLVSLFNTLAEDPSTIAGALGKTNEQIQAMEKGQVFVELLKKVKAAGKEAPSILEDLGIKGGAAQSAFLGLSQQADAVTKSMGFAAKGFADVSLLQKEFEERSATLRAQLGFLKDQIQALFTRIGAFLLPIVTALVKVFRFFVSVISAIPTPILGVIGVVFGLIAGAVLLANVAYVLIGTWKRMISNVDDLLKGFGLTRMALFKQAQALYANTRAWILNQLAQRKAGKGLFTMGGAMSAAKNGLGMLRGGLASMGPAAASALAALGPVGAIIAAVVAAIILALVVVPKLFDMFDSGTGKTKALALALMIAFWPLVQLYVMLRLLWTMAKAVFEVLFDMFSEMATQIFGPFLALFDAIGDSMGKTVSIWETLEWVLSAVASVIKFNLMVILWPVMQLFKAIGFVIKVIIAYFAFLVDVIVDFFAPAIEALVGAWDALVAAFKPVMDLFQSSGKESAFLAGALSVLKWVIQSVAGVAGFFMKIVLWPLKAAIWVVTILIHGLAAVFGFLADTVKWVVKVVTLGLFGSSLFHIAEGVSFVLWPLQLLMNFFSAIGKVIESVAKIVTGFFSLFGGGGGLLKMDLGIAFGNVFIAGSLWGDAIVKGAVSGKGNASVVENKSAGGGMGGGGFGGLFGQPIPVVVVMEPDKRAAAGGGPAIFPEIVVPITLMLDGQIVAEVVQRHQATEASRFFNPSSAALRGLGEA